MKKIYLLLLFSICYVYSGNAQITLSQTTSNAIIPNNTVACTTGDGVPDDNTYYRAFDLTSLGYAQFDVNQVSFGIDKASSIDPTFLVDVIIYSNSGEAFPNGTLTEINSVPVSITSADANSVKTVAINASVMAPNQLVFAVKIPDEVAQNHTTVFLLGSNSAGQSTPGYFASEGCGFTTSTITSIGFPNVHMVMNVTGLALSVNEFLVPKVSISPNPATQFITIELNSLNTIIAVEIYSVTGRLVHKSSNNARINISNLNSGIYLMKVMTANGTVSKKLVKN